MSLSSTLFLLLYNASGRNLCVTSVVTFLHEKRSLGRQLCLTASSFQFDTINKYSGPLWGGGKILFLKNTQVFKEKWLGLNSSLFFLLRAACWGCYFLCRACAALAPFSEAGWRWGTGGAGPACRFAGASLFVVWLGVGRRFLYDMGGSLSLDCHLMSQP